MNISQKIDAENERTWMRLGKFEHVVQVFTQNHYMLFFNDDQMMLFYRDTVSILHLVHVILQNATR